MQNPARVGSAPTSRRYWIVTYGCQMNVHDSEVLSGILEDMGYAAAETEESADLILINTCSVREKAEEKLFSRLGRLRGLKSAAAETPSCGGAAAGSGVRIGVAGCIAQQRGEEILDREACVDFVIGTRAIHALPEVVSRVENGSGRQVMTDDLVEFEAPSARRGDRVKAFVTIMEGCNNYCSFCIVPTTRGFEVYRSAAAIIDEIRGLAIRGYREVTLLGQNVNSWTDPDSGIDFPALLVRIDRELDSLDSGTPGGVERVRFLTSHPKDLSPMLIEAMGSCRSLAKHLHLPVQSGSDRVLRMMNRHYTAASYRDQIETLRSRVEGVGLSTDLIVGFPGETRADFEATLDLVRSVEYDSFYSFEYSPRPGTAALRYDDEIPPQVRRDRLIELQAVGREIQERRNATRIGGVEQVLVDGISKRSPSDVTGRTTANHVVNLPASPQLVGRLVDVRITGSGPHSLYGEQVGRPH